MKSEPVWLSLEQAATHVKMGKSALYAAVREGRVPSQKGSNEVGF